MPESSSDAYVFRVKYCNNFIACIFQNIILPRKGTCLRDMDVFDKHLVLILDEEGSSLTCSVNLPIDVNCKVPNISNTHAETNHLFAKSAIVYQLLSLQASQSYIKGSIAGKKLEISIMGG